MLDHQMCMLGVLLLGFDGLLIHNDYNFDNLHQNGPKPFRNLKARMVIAFYCRLRRFRSSIMRFMLFDYRFGLFKLAVIVQQIYARYAARQTRNARFAGLNGAEEVEYCIYPSQHEP